MSPATYVLGVSAAIMVLIVVIEMLRRGHFRERHAAWWLGAGAVALIAAIFPATLEWAALLLGVEVPVNLIFFLGIAVLFFVCLQHSSELTRLESKTRALAERVAILELELKQSREHRSQGE